MRSTNILMLASLNKGKIIEYRELFKEYPEYRLKVISEVAFNPVALEKVEDGTSYYENAFKKCQVAHYAAKLPTFSDDTGLEVDALDGRPGLHSAREGSIKKILEELKGVPKAKRTARFVCTTVFMVEGIVLSATEKLEGHILEEASGANGFGFDPIFIPEGSEKSLARMTLQEKNKISHRAKAYHRLIQEIKAKEIKLVYP